MTITVTLLMTPPDRDVTDQFHETIASKEFDDLQAAGTYVGKLRSIANDMEQTTKIVEVHS